jgi:phage major head subunit gpT-like protein
MTITRSQITDALDANLNELYQDGLTSWDNEYETIFNIENSDKQSEKDSYESGFQSMPEKPEGVAATYDTILPGISKTYTHKTYAMGYEITEEALEDNLRTSDTFNKLPAALARSGTETVEVTAANIFNNGFATTGFDGKVLFATDHPNLDGSSQSNRPSVHADLSVTSLTAGITALEKFVDERSLKRPTKGRLLVVPVDSWNLAAELLDSEYKPFSANNEINALNEKDLNFFVWHYLTDTDSWFLLARKIDTKLKFFWRARPGSLRRGNDFDTTNLKHLARMRFAVGYSHWMGTYGTSGA